MKNILVLIHNDAGQEARLQVALDVTRALNGHLSCLDVAAMMPAFGDASGSYGGAILIELEQANEADNKARLMPRLAREGVAWTWLDTTGFFEPSLESAADLSDLIVVNTALEALAMPDQRALAASLVVRSAKPILAVPDGARGLDVAGAALIAWDGSREASAALGAAVPLLALAEVVTIVEVDDGSIRIPAEEAAAYLSRHGIHPRISRSPAGPVADILLSRVDTGTFDYLVMGAFGHSRLAEALFGGVTRRMLKDSPVPIFIVH